MAQHTDNQLPVGITEARVLKAAEDILSDLDTRDHDSRCILCSRLVLPNDRDWERLEQSTHDVGILASYAKALLG